MVPRNTVNSKNCCDHNTPIEHVLTLTQPALTALNRPLHLEKLSWEPAISHVWKAMQMAKHTTGTTTWK